MVELIRKLAEGRLDYVLVGGLAAVLHGSSTVTQDVDVCCCLDLDNLLRLESAFGGLHPRLRKPAGPSVPLPAASDLVGFRNVYLDTDLGSIDLLGEILGVGGWAQVRQRSVEVEIWGLPIRVLSLEALIASKRALGRPKDVQVLRELEVILERQGEP